MVRSKQDKTDAELGMGPSITRKDFLNATLLGAGSALLNSVAPGEVLAALSRSTEGTALGVSPPGSDPWTGYGGVGDYARSNGNTSAVMEAAHRVRDGAYRTTHAPTHDSDEDPDLVIVGASLSGLSTAYYFQKLAGGRRKVLLLESHPIFGGECKQNEFLVNGERLFAPQGSNNITIPAAGSGTLGDELFADLRIPREHRFQEPAATLRRIRFPVDNYASMDGVAEHEVDVGYFFDSPQGAGPKWLSNIWSNDLKEAPFPEGARRDLLKWRTSTGHATESFRRFLDTMTYRDYIEGVMGLRSEVTQFITPYTTLINGVSPDAVSAWAAHQVNLPGVRANIPPADAKRGVSFPGGNTELVRYLVKALIPDAIAGSSSFEDITLQSVRFDAFDRSTNATRLRVGATVVRVAHEGVSGDRVSVTYEKSGVLHRVKARRVVMASGGWINKHVIVDLPASMQAAYAQFVHSPAMIVNVALTNWRWFDRLGYAAARWFDGGFGFSCSLRRSMIVGDYHPPCHPDKPAVLTFYMGFGTPGLAAEDQVRLGRAKLLSTPFADFERQCRAQMLKMFGDAGFEPSRDIAGIVLNRWGHARLVQPPGWFFGRDGKPPAREVIQNGFGRIVMAHAELNGHQSWTGALAQGHRAAEKVMVLA